MKEAPHVGLMSEVRHRGRHHEYMIRAIITTPVLVCYVKYPSPCSQISLLHCFIVNKDAHEV